MSTRFHPSLLSLDSQVEEAYLDMRLEDAELEVWELREMFKENEQGPDRPVLWTATGMFWGAVVFGCGWLLLRLARWMW